LPPEIIALIRHVELADAHWQGKLSDQLVLAQLLEKGEAIALRQKRLRPRKPPSIDSVQPSRVLCTSSAARGTSLRIDWLDWSTTFRPVQHLLRKTSADPKGYARGSCFVLAWLLLISEMIVIFAFLLPEMSRAISYSTLKTSLLVGSVILIAWGPVRKPRPSASFHPGVAPFVALENARKWLFSFFGAISVGLLTNLLWELR
jgi:hypothetical protein